VVKISEDIFIQVFWVFCIWQNHNGTQFSGLKAVKKNHPFLHPLQLEADWMYSINISDLDATRNMSSGVEQQSSISCKRNTCASSLRLFIQASCFQKKSKNTIKIQVVNLPIFCISRWQPTVSIAYLSRICLALSTADEEGKRPILPSSKTEVSALTVEDLNAPIGLQSKTFKTFQSLKTFLTYSRLVSESNPSLSPWNKFSLDNASRRSFA